MTVGRATSAWAASGAGEAGLSSASPSVPSQAPGTPLPGGLKRRGLLAMALPGWLGLRQPLPASWPDRGAGRIAPESEAALRWPDGRLSSGTVHQTRSGPVFTLAGEGDAVLAERRSKLAAPAFPPGQHRVRLAVESVGDAARWFQPRLPTLPMAPGPGGWLDTKHACHFLTEDGRVGTEPMQLADADLAALVRVAGGNGEKPLDWQPHAAVQVLLGRSLKAVAPQCADPTAARRVARALERGDGELILLFGLPKLCGPRGRAAASFDAAAFRRLLAGLAPARHAYVRVALVNGEAGHALAIAVRKEPGRRVRLAIINPAGWPQAAACVDRPVHPRQVVPAVFKTVGIDAAAAAMSALLAGRMPNCPEAEGVQGPTSPGHALYAWLEGIDDGATAPQADFHGTGRPLLGVAQKKDDCTIERVFAFMATALPPADYKLAKAAGLNALVQLADRLEPPHAAAAGSPLQQARRHLLQRMTASLSGSALARGALADG
jgi:hypothetical protein